MKKFISLLLAAVMVLGCFGFVFADDAADGLVIAPAPTAAASNDIVIMHTNDVHCGYLPYDKLATLAKDADLLVDAGDAIQGDVIGTLSKGEYINEIMNKLGYDVATFGNHEFDYSLDQLKKIVDAAEFPYVSCNFVDLKTKEALFDAYKVLEVKGKKIAFVGVTTPETFVKSTPTYFQDDKGNYIYGFCEGNNGQDLYDAVQKAVDAAKKEADYVILLAHLGIDEESTPWTSKDVIKNVSGVDAIIDGHSHSTFAETMTDKDGKEVPAAQTGTKLENVGKLTIKEDGTITVENIATADVEADAEMTAFVAEITARFDELQKQVVAKTSVDLTTKNADGSRAVRNKETNLGDLCADAYLNVMGADVAFVNGGGVRADIPAGDITFGQIVSVHPFGNVACLVEVTGQQIKDALELGASALPGELGGFLQVAGLTYTVDLNKDSHVVLNDQSEFVKVDGDYRVTEIMVGGEPLDVNKTYKLASHNYMLKSCGDGYAMFGTNNVKLLLDETVIDNQVLINYIVDSLGGVVGEEYAQPQGRITIIDKAFTDVSEKDWFQGAAIYAKENKLFAGYPDGSFKGKNTMTMKELAAVLYNVAGAQEETVEGAWYATQQAWMEKNAIVDTFEADATVTREDFITMFVKTLALKGTDTAATEEMKAALEKAVDYADIAEENADAIAWAVNAGLISGTSTDALTISPATEMNRATVAAMLKNYYTKAEAPLAGGWTAAADGTVTEELKGYFEKATKALMGAKYTPVKLLGTQVVAGTNYKVLCEKTTVTAEPTTTTVTVVLYVDLEGNCTITSIE